MIDINKTTGRFMNGEEIHASVWRQAVERILRKLEIEAKGFGEDITSQLQGHTAQVSAAYYGTSKDQLRNAPLPKSNKVDCWVLYFIEN